MGGKAEEMVASYGTSPYSTVVITTIIEVKRAEKVAMMSLRNDILATVTLKKKLTVGGFRSQRKLIEDGVDCRIGYWTMKTD